MKKSSVYDCTVIELPTIKDRSGNITPVSNNEEIPFSIKRVFYIYDIPGGEDRGAHAHKECHQFLVAASGSFEIELNDILERDLLENINYLPSSYEFNLHRSIIKKAVMEALIK